MAIYRDFKSAPRATLRKFDPTAARYLTGPDMVEARHRALVDAAAGKRVTAAEAKKARRRVMAVKRSAAKTADKYAPRSVLSPEKIKTAIAALEKDGRKPTAENVAQRLRVATSAVGEEMEKISAPEPTTFDVLKRGWLNAPEDVRKAFDVWRAGETGKPK